MIRALNNQGGGFYCIDKLATEGYGSCMFRRLMIVLWIWCSENGCMDRYMVALLFLKLNTLATLGAILHFSGRT